MLSMAMVSRAPATLMCASAQSRPSFMRGISAASNGPIR